MIDGVSIVIPTRSPTPKTLQSLAACPVPHQIILSNYNGVGKTRHMGALKAKFDLLVMFDDDLAVSSEIWRVLLNCGLDEFIMTYVGGNLSTRVFAVHREMYLLVGGFDPAFRYVFEDGEFALRAQRLGLKLRVISPKFIVHVEHTPRAWVGPFRFNLGFWWAWAQCYVRFGRRFEPNLFDVFRLRLDWRVAVQWWVLRVVLFVGALCKACLRLMWR